MPTVHKCKFCNYSTDKNYSYKKHLETKKHINNEKKHSSGFKDYISEQNQKSLTKKSKASKKSKDKINIVDSEEGLTKDEIIKKLREQVEEEVNEKEKILAEKKDLYTKVSDLTNSYREFIKSREEDEKNNEEENTIVNNFNFVISCEDIIEMRYLMKNPLTTDEIQYLTETVPPVNSSSFIKNEPDNDSTDAEKIDF